MSIASTNKDIIRVKEQIRQLSAGIPTFDGSLYSQVGHTHSIPQIAELSTALAGKQNTLTAGTNININGNTINATGASQWTSGAGLIYFDGNVGISTALPVRKLQVPNSTRGSISVYGSGDVRYHCYNLYGEAGWLWGQKSAISDNWTLSKLVNTTETDVLAVSIDGNVGIGTNYPQTALDVVGLVKSTVGFQHGNTVLKNITYTTADIVLVNDYYYMFNSTYFMDKGLRGTVLYSATSSTNHRNNGVIFIDSAYNIIEHIRWMYNNGIDVDVISGDFKLKNATGSQNTFKMTFTLLG